MSHKQLFVIHIEVHYCRFFRILDLLNLPTQVAPHFVMIERWALALEILD